MTKQLITIFTPTYNRAKLLTRIFESLINQTNKNFIWLIIDDGSSDDTLEIVNKFKKTADFKIEYYYKTNGGKHTAHNTAVLKCKTDYFLILDSDDFLSADAIEVLNNKIKIIDKDNTISGIIGNRFDLNGNVIGNRMPKNIKCATGAELYEKYKLKGDTLRFYKTKILKQHLFPEFISEKFLPENIVFDKIDINYKMLIITEKLYYCDYQEEGYSNNIFAHNLASPMGYALSLFSFYKTSITLKSKIKWMMLYQLWKIRFPNINFINEYQDKIIYILLYPLSYIFNFFKIPRFMYGKDGRKNALIITLYGNYNFGNKLQNYALQTVLNKIGLKVETLRIKYRHLSLYKNIKIVVGDTIKYILNFRKNKKRLKSFYQFNNYLYYTKMKFSVNSYFYKKLKKYDYYIFGSDQIWNPSCFGNSQLFLGYKSDFEKNIAYSASFGVSELDDSINSNYKKGLNNFCCISVREESGKKIIKKLTGRKDVEVLIDPTMLLTEKEWNLISKKPKYLKEDRKYILNYFLGELSVERKKEIEKIAKENNCDVINILDKNSKFYASGPSEFLYLEKHAFLVCTDSFHSCVFAFLYNRPFIVFDREAKGIENMNSRIDTLISKFKLKNRKYMGNISSKNINHDYKEAYEILEKEREKANSFLRKALNIDSKIGDVDE